MKKSMIIFLILLSFAAHSLEKTVGTYVVTTEEEESRHYLKIKLKNSGQEIKVFPNYLLQMPIEAELWKSKDGHEYIVSKWTKGAHGEGAILIDPQNDKNPIIREQNSAWPLDWTLSEKEIILSIQEIDPDTKKYRSKEIIWDQLP